MPLATRLSVAVLGAAAIAAIMGATAFAGRGQEKITLCHVTGSGVHQITVAEPAVAAHMGHGDYMPEYGDC